MCAAAGSVAEKMERNRGGRKTGNRQGQEILCRIWGRETGALKYWEFQVRKTERLLAILSAGLAMALLCQIFLTTGGLEPLTELLRPDSGEGDRTYVLDAEVGDEKLRRISVSGAGAGAVRRRGISASGSGTGRAGALGSGNSQPRQRGRRSGLAGEILRWAGDGEAGRVTAMT